jgi:hypothetical protein
VAVHPDGDVAQRLHEALARLGAAHGQAGDDARLCGVRTRPGEVRRGDARATRTARPRRPASRTPITMSTDNTNVQFADNLIAEEEARRSNWPRRSSLPMIASTSRPAPRRSSPAPAVQG